MTRERITTRHDSVFTALSAVWERRKWLAIPIFIALSTIMISLVMALPNLYRAKAMILVKQEPLSDSGRTSGAVDIESRLQVINEEILSRSRLQEMINRFDLYPELSAKISSEMAVERMRRDIHFTRKDAETRWGQPSTVAFTISYQGWNPKTATGVTNALAAMYVAENEKFRPHPIAVSPPPPVPPIHGAPDGLAQLKNELAQMRTSYSDRYPDVLRLKEEITALQRNREEMRDEPALVSPQNPQTRATRAAPSTDNQGWEKFRIIDPAIVPTEPFAPNRMRVLLLGLILAIATAGFAALLAEQFDTSFHRLDELWAYTNMPILAGIPRILTRADVWRQRLRFGLAGLLIVSVMTMLVQASYSIGLESTQLVWMLAQRGI